MIISKNIEDLQIENMDQYYQEILLNRGIPDIRDGLTKIQRRILFIMNENNYTKDFIKCANVVGLTTLLHPHGDMSIYGTLVNMATDFSNNQILIEPHGNFGTIYGDEYAASRYTECKLNKFSINCLLDNIKENSVDFVPSFDNRKKEPSVLPAKLPLILINGSFGIGGGYMSSIPPHRIESVIKAIKILLDDPEIPVRDLIIKSELYPSFPTGGIIINKNEIINNYCNFDSKGKKSIKIRSKIINDEKNHRLIITEIPYMKYLDGIKKSIKDAISDKDNKKIQGIKNIIDGSEKGKISLYIYCNKEYDLDTIKNQLYKYTLCQSSIPLSAVAVNNNELSIYHNIKEILQDWLEFRKETIKRIKRNNIKNIEYRIHILKGLLTVLKDNIIDELVKIVKSGKSKQDIIYRISNKFSLTEIQATYIAELKLYSLNKFEINKLIDEKNNLEGSLNNEIEFLKNESKINNYINNDLETIFNSKFINKNLMFNTDVINDSEILTEDSIEDEDFILILTKNGYLKKIQNTIRNQKRNGAGISIGNIKENDIPKKILNVNSRDNILIFTTTGKLFVYKCYDLPKTSLKSYGKLISSMVKNENIVTILSLSNEELKNKNLHIISSSKKGKIKMSSITEFTRLNSSGIIYSKVAEDDEIISVNIGDIKEGFSIISVNSKGNVINISHDDIPIVGRVSFGSNIFSNNEIKNGATIINSVIVNNNTEGIIIITENGFGKRVLISEIPIQKRNGVGRLITKFKTKTDRVASVLSYNIEDTEKQLIIMASKSMINIPLSDIIIP